MPGSLEQPGWQTPELRGSRRALVPAAPNRPEGPNDDDDDDHDDDDDDDDDDGDGDGDGDVDGP